MTVPLPDGTPARPSAWVRSQLVTGWLLVGIPLAYGLYETLLKAVKLF